MKRKFKPLIDSSRFLAEIPQSTFDLSNPSIFLIAIGLVSEDDSE